MKFDLSQTTEESLLAFFRTSTRLDRAVTLVDLVEENAPGMFCLLWMAAYLSVHRKPAEVK